MRSTLTLEPDVAEALKTEQRRTQRTFKEVVNQALRRGLRLGHKPAARLAPFRVEPHHCGFRPGVDTARLNQLSDEIEVGAATPNREPSAGRR